MMRLRSLLTFAAFTMLTLAASAADAQERRTVTLAAALELAHAHQPDLAVARGAAATARAAATKVRAARLPSVDASASYSYGGGNPGDPADPSGAGRLGLAAGWLLFDFGHTGAAVDAADASAAASADQERQAELDLALSVRSAYFATRAAKELVGVARDTLANEERHLQQIEAFVEVGRRPEIDRYQARTQLANARVALIQAENVYDVARAQLARAIGDAGGADLDVADDSMPVVAGEDAADDVLYAEALRARPDLAALAGSRRASSFNLDAARAAFLPELNASAGLDGVALQGDPGWGWSAGLTLSWRIFDGGARRADIRSAEVAVVVADARREVLAQNVRVELRQARLAVRAAKAARAAAGEAIDSARKQLELAEGRYAEGVGNAIELGDAQVEVSRASAQAVQSDYDLATARAQLVHALGR